MKLQNINNGTTLEYLENSSELKRLAYYKPYNEVRNDIGLVLRKASFFGIWRNDDELIVQDINILNFSDPEPIRFFVEGVVVLSKIPVNIGGPVSYHGYGRIETESGLLLYDGRGGGQNPNNIIPGVQEAPVDGQQYARKNESWVVVEGGVTSVNEETGDVVLTGDDIELSDGSNITVRGAIEYNATTANNINGALFAHVGDSSNPHGVTAAQVGLDQVDNTADADKEVSTATQSAIDDVSLVASDNTTLIGTQGLEINENTAAIGTNTTNLDSHVGDTNNPHQVTAEQVGLENVDNTSDADKEVSTATQGAIDSINGEVSNNTTNITDNNNNIQTNNTNIANHVGDSNNPHGVTSSQLGLENVDNTSDLEKPISNDTQGAINDVSLLASDNAASIVTQEQAILDNNENIGTNTTNLDSHVTDIANPHGVTSSQLGLENVDNTADADKPVSNDTQSAIDDVSLTASDNANLIGTQGQAILDNNANIGTNTTNLDSHVTDIANPHSVTATQVGLENVDNTSDLDKPVSTDTQALADLKINYTDNPSATQTGGIRAVYTESSSTLIMSIDGVNIV